MVRRAIKLQGTNVLLEISKFATPSVAKEFIHLDKLPDGTWRLLWNVKDAPDTSQIEALVFIRIEE
jgi:hypothetical protein